MTNALDALIANKQTEVDDLRGRLSIAEAELRAFLAAKEAVGGHKPKPAENPIGRASESQPRARVGTTWTAILRRIESYRLRTFSVDDVMQVAEQLGLSMNRNAVRSNLANYHNKNMGIRRIADGKYELVDFEAFFSDKNEKASVTTEASQGHVAELDSRTVSQTSTGAQAPSGTRENVGSSPTVSAPFHRTGEKYLTGSSLSSAQPTLNLPWKR